MKGIHHLAALLSAAMVFTSCSRDSEQPQTKTSAQEVKVPTKTVSIELEATKDPSKPEKLRLAFQNEASDMGSIARSPIMSDKDLKVQLAVTAQGTAQTAYQTLVFKKVQGENRVIYKGQLQVPDTGTSSYTLTAIILGEVDGDSMATLETESRAKAIPTGPGLAISKDGQILNKMPYTAETTAKLDNTGKAFEKTELHFKSSGTLLRFRITNATGEQQTFSRIMVSSNAFYPEWSYQLGDMHSGNLAAGSVDDLGEWSKTYEIEPLTLQNGQVSDKWYYCWVMPRNATGDANLKTRIVVRNTDGKSYLGAERKTSLALGSVGLELKPQKRVPTTTPCYTGGSLPHQWLEWAFVDPTGTNLRPIVDSEGSYRTDLWGYFSWAETQNINIPGYHVPTIQEWRCIFPTAAYYYGKVTSTKEVDETFTVGSETVTLKAQYKSTDSNNIYAIRGMGGDNCHRIAYRYTRVGDYGDYSHQSKDVNRRFVVTIKYIGDRDDVDIDYIMTESTFWDDAEAKLVFPISGIFYSNNAKKAGNLHYHYLSLWTRTDLYENSGKLYSQGGTNPSGDNIYAGQTFIDASLSDSKAFVLPVMLFKNQL